MTTRLDDTALRAWLVDWVTRVTGADAGDVRPDRPFQELGLSSRDAVTLVGELEELLDRSISPTLAWDLPTIDAVVANLLGGPAEIAAPARAAATEPQEHDDDDPIVVVGVGCRLPGGVQGPEDYWRLLLDGADGIAPVPAERWASFADRDDPALDLAVPRGGYLEDVTGFDAEYFGLSDDEAELMDPQQRLLLEVAVETMQHAGVPVDALRGTPTGVYVGISASEYGYLTTSRLAGIESWTATGSALSIAANRLSYLLDLRGPSLAVDTACSSSLVALHTALGAMRAGECSRAVVAGVNLLLSPAVTIALGQGGALADDAHCKAFSDDADGIGRAEGCVALLLERRSQALAEGHRVLAVVHGSAVNSDGRSNGLTAPNVGAQQAVLRAAYERAGIDPASVDYLEAHGTGTPLGDPIEAAALGAVLGHDRPADRPLLLGSVKTNLGHLEAAAGLAGVAKVVLALAAGTIPATRNFRAPNPALDLAAQRLEIADTARDWPRWSGRALAGVSAFGFGGTNAHVVLGEAPALDVEPAAADTAGHALVLRAPTAANLRADAAALADHLTNAMPRLTDVGATLLRHRGHGAHTACVVGVDADDLRGALHALAAGTEHPQVITPAGPLSVGRSGGLSGGRSGSDAVWVFSGYGAQWTGMARELAAHEPVFAAALREASEHLVAAGGPAVCDLVTAGQAPRDLEQTQVALFAIQIALSALWRRYGETPAAVVGHSMGEVAAAVVSGALDLAQGARVMAVRARLLAGVEVGGAMAVLGLPAQTAEFLMSRHPDVVVAVYSSPAQCTVAGPQDQIDALAADVEGLGFDVWRLPVAGAGHSPAVDPVLPALRAELAELTPHVPHVPFYSTVTDDPTGWRPHDADYWADNARQAVRFTQAIAAALADGHRTFLEISAHPMATRSIVATAAESDAAPVTVLASLRRGIDGRTALAEAMAHRHLTGAPAALAARYATGRRIDLPRTAWRHRPFWHTPARTTSSANHPLLGAHAELPEDGRHVWTGRLGSTTDAWLAERAVRHGSLLPLAAVAEMALAAGAVVHGTATPALTDVELTTSVPLGEAVDVTTTLLPAGDGSALVQLHVRTMPGAPWRLCARATVTTAEASSTQRPAALPDVPALRVTPSRHGHARRAGVVLDPTVLDAMLTSLVPRVGDVDAPYAAQRTGSLRVHAPIGAGGGSVVVTARLVHPDGRITGDVELRGSGGGLIAEALGVVLTQLEHVALPMEALLFERRLDPADVPDAPSGTGSWLLVAAPTEVPVARELAAALEGAGRRAALATDSAALSGTEPPQGVVFVAPHTAGPGEARGVFARAAQLAAAVAEHGSGARFVVLTRGAAAVDGETGQAGTAALRGLVRVLALEHPEVPSAIVDLGLQDPVDALLPELLGGAADVHDDEVVRRGDQRWVARLHRAPVQTSPARPVVGPHAYVVTELDGPGVAAARWLAASGARRLVLASRRDDALADPDLAQVVAQLRASGTDVVLVAGDIADADVAGRIVVAAVAEGLELRGVLHTAGVLADGLLADLDAADIDVVWRPKVDGCVALAEATAAHPLDWFVVYSAAAGLVGSPGQAVYAGANAYLDAYADELRAAGRPATSVQWGAWSTAGASGNQNALLEPIEPEQGLDALASVLATGRTELAVARLDPARALALLPSLSRRSFFVGFATAAADAPASDWPGVQALAGLDPRVAADRIAELVRGHVAKVMNAAVAEHDVDLPLTDLGLDSLTAIRARNAVQHDTGVVIPTRLLLQGASLRDLEAFLLGELGIAAPDPSTADEPGDDRPAAAHLRPPGARAGWVPARNPSERFLTGIWQDVLGRRPIGVTEDFVELGGDEAAALLVAARISERLDWAPTLEQLLANPTIETAAELVRDRLEGNGGSPLRVLRAPRAHAARDPLFLFHPAGGPTTVYSALVDRLDPRQPVYGFERLDDVHDVESKAARYVEIIRELHPDGPYLLAGWSFGGILAGEVAAQLEARGDDVELLTLLDTIIPLPAESESLPELLTGRFRRFGDYIRDTYGAELDVDYESLLDAPEAEGMQQMFLALTRAGVNLPAGVLEHQFTSYADARIAERYQPKSFTGRVILYRAQASDVIATTIDPRYLRTDEALGWDGYCPDLEIVHVTGDHISMIDPPHIDAVAVHLDRVLTELSLRRRDPAGQSA